MCIKNEPPLSTVRVLANALSLNPIPTPEPPHPETQPTPSEIALFRRTFLSHLTRTNLNITERDREEMRTLGIPPITDAEVATARERYAQEQEAARERLESERRSHALPLRLNPDPVMPQAPIRGPPLRDVGTNAFETRTLEDALLSPRPEGPAPRLEIRLHALMADLLRTRREDEDGGGEGGSGD